MLTVENRYWLNRAVRYVLVFGLVLALKQFYSAAHAAQLQWMLYPLVLMLELFSDMHFRLMPDDVWLDQTHRVSIVKACAGINFLIISLLANLWLQRQQAPSVRILLHVCLTAWLSTLGANTLRVLLCVYGQHGLADITGISEEDSHRAIGIAVYFLCLWTQLSAFTLQNLPQRALIALIFYFSITLLLPYFRAWLLELELPNTPHALWVLGVPSALVILSFIWRPKLTCPVTRKPRQFEVAAKKPKIA